MSELSNGYHLKGWLPVINREDGPQLFNDEPTAKAWARDACEMAGIKATIAARFVDQMIPETEFKAVVGQYVDLG